MVVVQLRQLDVFLPRCQSQVLTRPALAAGAGSSWALAIYSSRSASSPGTTVREQHEQYFEAQGDLCLARTVFFEQLIAQLIVWKTPIQISSFFLILMEMYILGTFPNVFLNPTSCSVTNASNVLAFIHPPPSGMAPPRSMQSLPLLVLNVPMHTSSLTEEVWVITGVSFLISHPCLS
jgi:hypothetical protein